MAEQARMEDCRRVSSRCSVPAKFSTPTRGICFAPGPAMAKPRQRIQDSGSTAPSAPQNDGDTTASAPDRERIAMRAYELYLARGGTDGREMDDWLDAERELNPSGDSSREP